MKEECQVLLRSGASPGPKGSPAAFVLGNKEVGDPDKSNVMV